MNIFNRFLGSVDIDKMDKEGLTKLYRASADGQADVVQQLLVQGADVNRKSFYAGAKNSEGAKNGTTALHAVANRGHFHIVKILVEKGANVNARDINGCTPLWLSCMEGYADIVRYLIANGADVDLSNGYESRGYTGSTPLMTASKFGRTDVVRILLDSGALVNKATWRGDTALDEALESENEEIIVLLRNAGGVFSSQRQKEAMFIALYRKFRNTSEMSRMEIIEKVRKEKECESIPIETALIWAKGADLTDGIIRL